MKTSQGLIVAAILSALAIVATQPGCQNFDAWKAESAAIRADIEATGVATPEQLARIQQIDDDIQAAGDLFDLAQGVLLTVAGGTPVGLLGVAGIGVWKRRFGQLVENVHTAGGVDTGRLSAANESSGLQTHVDKPLKAAKKKAKLSGGGAP